MGRTRMAVAVLAIVALVLAAGCGRRRRVRPRRRRQRRRRPTRRQMGYGGLRRANRWKPWHCESAYTAARSGLRPNRRSTRSRTGPTCRSRRFPGCCAGPAPVPPRPGRGSSTRSPISASRRQPARPLARRGPATPPTASCSPTCRVPTSPRSSSATKRWPPSSGRSVLILSTHGRRAAREMVLDLAARVDGIVVLGPHRRRRGHRRPRRQEPPGRADRPRRRRRRRLRQRRERGERRALVDHLSPGTATATRVPRRRQSSHRHLAALGRTPARPAGPRHRRRARPLRCAFHEDGGRVEPPRGADRGDRPRALVCANDEIALGAITAAEHSACESPTTSPSPAGTTSWRPATPGPA